MVHVREIMTSGARCIGENDSLQVAAALMAELDVGALPICGEDSRLKGMLTDRDIVIKAVAAGIDTDSTRSGEFAVGKPVTVAADDDISVALRLMQEHQIRRLPVIENHLLVGIITQADISRALPPEETGETVERISQPTV